jgi:hypothetical protein
MKSNKRFVRLAVGAVLILVLLAAAALLVVPRFLDSEAVLAAVQREVSDRSGGSFTLERVKIDLLPLPHLTVFFPRFVRGKEISVRADRVVLHPRILPLLMGDIELARLQVVSPTGFLALSETAAAADASPPAVSIESVVAAVPSAVDQIRRQVPDLSVEMTGGALTVDGIGGPPLRLEQIEGSFSTTLPRLDVSCRSDLWESLRLRWTFDDAAPPGAAQITVFQLRPAPVVNRLLPEAGPMLHAARVNLSVKVDPKEGGFPSLSFSGDLPEAVFERENQQVSVSASLFAGSVGLQKAGLQIIVDRWQGQSPDLDLSARFDFGRIGGKDLTLRQIEVKGKGIDVSQVKAPVLFFGGGESVLEDVFDVLRAGQVEQLMLRARIPGPQQVFTPEDFSLEGRIKDGEIHIPQVDLDLKSAAGRADIRGGVLTAGDLKATYGNSSATDGALTLSLFDGTDRFKLDTRVDADLSELPATLTRLIDAPAFTEGAEKIRSLEGRAVGRLVLGESFTDLRPRVEVEQISATAAFTFLPVAVEITGQGLSYSGTSVSALSFDLSAGGASARGISGRLQWDGEPTIEARAESVEARIDPVMAWLPQLPLLGDRFSDLSLSGGELHLSALALNGPVRSPERWRFDAVGAIEEMTLTTGRLPSPVTVSRLRFQAAPKNLRIDEFAVDMFDAALTGSGAAAGSPAAVEEVRLSLSGQIGPKADRWLLSRFRVPEQLAFRLHRISDGQLHWKQGGFLDLSGELQLDQNMRVSTDLSIGPGRFALKRLLVEDEDSQAEASFQRTSTETSFSFDGRLTRQTVDRLIKDNRLLQGSIMGGFRGRIDFESPAQSQIEGRLEIEKLGLPKSDGPDVRIVQASLFGEGHRLDVQRCNLTVDGSSYRVNGDLRRGQDAFTVDLALVAEQIDLNRIKEAFARETGAGDESQPARRRVPLNGVVNVDAEVVRYDRYRFDDVSGQVVLQPDRTEVTIRRGTLCGIAVPAELGFQPGSISFQVRPAVAGGQLSETLDCLFEESGPMEGRFSLNGSLVGSGSPEQILSSLQGGLTFSAREGLVRGKGGFGILQRVLALINLTEVFAGSMPDFSRSGFRYNSIKAKAEVEKGVMKIREMVVDGKNLTLTATGSVNLVDKGLDMTLLVAPLKTVDRIVGKIPLVNDILEGTLVSIPVRVRGTLAKPDVDFAAPSSVGRGLIGITERTLKLPFKVIQPDAPLESP